MILSKWFKKSVEEELTPEQIARKEKQAAELKKTREEMLAKALLRQITPAGTIYYY